MGFDSSGLPVATISAMKTLRTIALLLSLYWGAQVQAGSWETLVKGYRTVVPAETPKVPVNKWAKFRVEVRGTKVKLIVDGEDAWETDKLDAASGYIGIQAEDKPFEFRNIRVQSID